jgi:hypothetical protein
MQQLLVAVSFVVLVLAPCVVAFRVSSRNDIDGARF